LFHGAVTPASQNSNRDEISRNRNRVRGVSKDVATASAPTISLTVSQRSRFEEERVLVCLVQKGEQSAFEDLVRRYQDRVFALVAGILHRQGDVND